jgi:hypothetical protein
MRVEESSLSTMALSGGRAYTEGASMVRGCVVELVLL